MWIRKSYKNAWWQVGKISFSNAFRCTLIKLSVTYPEKRLFKSAVKTGKDSIDSAAPTET